MLAHADPGGGYSGDVVGERHYAYLSSRRGRADCPAQGVRVYDLANPRRPRHVSTFAALQDTWTEKTIVRRVQTAGFDGVLAVTSVQACAKTASAASALFDVTRPGHPRRLALVRTVPRGSHEIWLATARGHAWVYTAEAATEFAVAPRFVRLPHLRRLPPAQAGRGRRLERLPGPARLHAAGPRDRRRPRYLVHSVITNAAATRAYLSYWDLGTVILDIHDPAHPATWGAPPRARATRTRRGSPGAARSCSRPTSSGTAGRWSGRSPTRRTRCSSRRCGCRPRCNLAARPAFGLADSVHDPKVLGRYAYFSWYGQGVALFDLKNPRKPRFVTRFRPPPERDGHELLCPGASCTAVWGVFPTRELRAGLGPELGALGAQSSSVTTLRSI